jgi:hypothetical protein
VSSAISENRKREAHDLPADDELAARRGAQLRFAFETEIKRLEAA